MKKLLPAVLLATLFYWIGYAQQATPRKVNIEAYDEITITTGKSSISMRKNGTILIQGNDIIVKSGKEVILKGSKIQEN